MTAFVERAPLPRIGVKLLILDESTIEILLQQVEF
jgi:hypothetical protein